MKVREIGRVVGTVILGILFVGWWLLDMASCVYVNPCPGYVDKAEAAYDRGDYDAAREAVEDFEEARCGDG